MSAPTINGIEIVRGVSIAMRSAFTSDLRIYGRVAQVGSVTGSDGDLVTFVTPAGTVLRAGLIWFDTLDAEGIARLREFEAPPLTNDYGGHLRPDEWIDVLPSAKVQP